MHFVILGELKFHLFPPSPVISHVNALNSTPSPLPFPFPFYQCVQDNVQGEFDYYGEPVNWFVAGECDGNALYIAWYQSGIVPEIAGRAAVIPHVFLPVIPPVTAAPVTSPPDGTLVKLTLRTGTHSNAGSNMGPKMLLDPKNGNSALVSFTEGDLPARGASNTYSVFLPTHFQGGIQSMNIQATTTDGWLISSASIQIGDDALITLRLTKDDGSIWLDGLPTDNASGYGGSPYSNLWTFWYSLEFPPSGTESTLSSSATDGAFKWERMN